MNGDDGENDAEGTSDDVATEIGEGEAHMLNIGGEASDGDTLAVGGVDAGIKLIV